MQNREKARKYETEAKKRELGEEIMHSCTEGQRDNREQERQSLFEGVMAENFPELIKDIDFSSRSTINPKQGLKKTHKETHTQTHHSDRE